MTICQIIAFPKIENNDMPAKPYKDCIKTGGYDAKEVTADCASTTAATWADCLAAVPLHPHAPYRHQVVRAVRRRAAAGRGEAAENGLPLTSSGANISGMNNILAIRRRLGLQQSEFADAIGVTQSNVSHYENGRNDPSLDVGRQVVALAKQMGHCVTLEDVFSEASK